MHMSNLFEDLPTTALPDELVNVLAGNSNVRIERIVSNGHASPEGFWFDQKEHEWIVVLQGEATLTFDDGESLQMTRGIHTLIPAHRKHRVEWTSHDEPTIWLAVFYRD